LNSTDVSVSIKLVLRLVLFISNLILTELFQYISQIVRADIEANSPKGSPIPVTTQVVAFLHYAAGHTFQLHIADTLSLSQRSLSSCISRVANSLANQADQFIYFPNSDQDIRRTKAEFYARGFPGVIGLIDCTHIHIRAPKLNVERDYVNRKGRHSINVQCIVDHRGKFMNVSASWPGCTHDSFILQHSNVYPAFENGQIDGILLGDAGYPNRRWLMTPFRNPNTAAQRK
jgi:nuclease HARBI1